MLRDQRPAWLQKRWRLLLSIALCLGLITAAHAAFGDKGEKYSVSVPVTFRPYDPNQWALFSASSFEAARALDPTLPDPYADDLMLPLPDGAGASSLTPGGSAIVAAPAEITAMKANSYVGPVARPFVFRGATAADGARALYCLTSALYYEAISESDDGMRGVAQVILNRVRHPSFPNSVCGVVFQGSDRITGCQFSYTCDGAMARQPSAGGWARSRRIAAEALSGRIYAGVGLATHYHTQAIWPRWGKSLVMTNVIGAHIFHRWRGRWGEAGAFGAPYSGREPMPGPYRSVATQLAERRGAAAIRGPGFGGYSSGSTTSPSAGQTPLDPKVAAAVAAAKAQEDARLGKAPVDAGSRSAIQAVPDYTEKAPAAAPAPRPAPEAKSQKAYLDKKLNQSGQVREEYQSSGQWIGQ
jgi:Cell Wall Hydrolase